MLQKRGFSEVFGGVGFRRANIHNPMRNELLYRPYPITTSLKQQAVTLSGWDTAIYGSPHSTFAVQKAGLALLPRSFFDKNSLIGLTTSKLLFQSAGPGHFYFVNCGLRAKTKR